MSPRQDNPDANNDAHEKTDHETESRGVTHRTVAEVKNSGRLVFVHGQTFRR